MLNAKVIIPASLLILALALILALRPCTVTTKSPENSAQQTDASRNEVDSSDSSSAEPSITSVAKSKLSLSAEQQRGAAANDVKNATSKTDDPFDYGKTPPVKADANEQVKSIFDAVRNKSHPERLSVMINPKPFDPEAYRRDPGSYLSIVEPGRINMPRQPGKGVDSITAISPTHAQISQNGSVILRVKAAPKYPVSWTSWDGGKFANELTSITVEADENGIAETTFFGAPGTIEDVHIVCVSPMCSGQIRFTVNVTKQ